MANQIVLAWTVDVSNTPLGPAAAATRLAAVPLYTDTVTDPVLGQLLGLVVSSDVTTAGVSTATRTLTLGMTPTVGAPPPFPCHPRTSTPPVLPYPLRTTRTLAGSFFVELGSMNVSTTATQVPAVSIGDSIQFLSQGGVFYVVASVSATTIGLTAPYTGTTSNTGAFKEVVAPVALDRLAVYSTSVFDTDNVATVPPIAHDCGANVVRLTYNDSTGAGPFQISATLTGKRPAAFTISGMQGIDVAEIVNFKITTTRDFGNSVGEITLVSLSAALPALPPNLPLGKDVGAPETTVGKTGAPIPRTFKTMTDEAQLLIDRHLAYLPPSYFSIAQQGASSRQLDGVFILTTGSKNVPTTADQTAALLSGQFIEFVDQIGTRYEIAQVTPKIVTLVNAYTGIDTNNTGLVNTGTNNNAGTMGNVGTSVISKPSNATLVSSTSSSGPPTNTQLAGPIAQFVATETAAPPLNPPLNPHTVPTPTFLSGLFTRTLQVALAGVPVVPATIT